LKSPRAFAFSRSFENSLYTTYEHEISGQSNLTQRRIAGADARFNRIRQANGWTNRFPVWVVDSGGPKEAQVNRFHQVAPMCPYVRAHWRHCALTWGQLPF